MSVPVELKAVADEVAIRGPFAHLITVAHDGRPHVVSVRVRADGDGTLHADPGAGTRTNLSAGRPATLIWAAEPGEDYSFLVDIDDATVVEGAPVVLVPRSAVRHRSAEAHPDLANCVTVLAKPDRR